MIRFPLSRLRKLRGLPPTELLRVLQFKTLKAQRSLRQDVRVRFVRKLWPGAGLTRYAALRSEIRFFSLSQWRDGGEPLRQVLHCLGGNYPEHIVNSADQACEHVFNLLGSGRVHLGQRVDWHRDFKSGAKWEPDYFRRIKEIELADASDIKVPWELSRCYHFVPLGMAYRLTNQEKYAREFVEQCFDWIEQNPPYHGVNWHCAMEVAIRAVNWIWGYYLFQDATCFDAQARSRIACLLAVHGEYIWNNVEFDKRVLGGRYLRHNGNHYVADLVGLIYLGLVLPGREAARWLQWGLGELDREMQVQVLPDGAHWELSPSYHRLVLELVLPAVILCEQNNIPVPESLRCACERMAEYTMHYLKPNGNCPLVRDADDGRVCLVGDNDYRDHRHLLALAGIFFGRPDLLARAGRLSGEVVWLLGRPGLEKAKSMSALPGQLPSKAFPDAGFYVLRDGEQVQVFVCCANVGMKGTYGGHAHNDCLSFELYCHGTTFITDSGTYNYSGDPAARNQFRSTASHNTARIDGQEINRFAETELFGMQNDAQPTVLKWRTEADSDYLEAEHFGYARLKSPVIHRRSFLLDRRSKALLLEDHFMGNGEHFFELFFHFFPGIEVKEVSEHCFEARNSDSAIRLSFSGDPGCTVCVESGCVSERYGVKREAYVIVLRCRKNAPARFQTTIVLCPEMELSKTHPVGYNRKVSELETLQAS